MRARQFIAYPLNKGIQTTIMNDSMRIVLREMVASCTAKSKRNLGEIAKFTMNSFGRFAPATTASRQGV
jgi:hypothetical protein